MMKDVCSWWLHYFCCIAKTFDRDSSTFCNFTKQRPWFAYPSPLTTLWHSYPRWAPRVKKVSKNFIFSCRVDASLGIVSRILRDEKWVRVGQGPVSHVDKVVQPRRSGRSRRWEQIQEVSAIFQYCACCCVYTVGLLLYWQFGTAVLCFPGRCDD